MTELIGTWKAVGSKDKDGKVTTKKAPLKFVFNEDGTGKMKFLIFSGRYRWIADGALVIVQGKSDMNFRLVDDTLVMEVETGDKCFFRKAA